MKLKIWSNMQINLKKILGNYRKSSNTGELKNINGLRRSAYLKNDLIKKQKLQEKDVIWQRPYMSSQKNLKEYFGKSAKRSLKKGSLILKNILNNYVWYSWIFWVKKY